METSLGLGIQRRIGKGIEAEEIEIGITEGTGTEKAVVEIVVENIVESITEIVKMGEMTVEGTKMVDTKMGGITIEAHTIEIRTIETRKIETRTIETRMIEIYTIEICKTETRIEKNSMIQIKKYLINTVQKVIIQVHIIIITTIDWVIHY